MEKTRAAEREEKRRFWEEHLERWEASGNSQNAYCRQNNLRLNRFMYWKKKRFPPKSTVSLVEWPLQRQEVASFAPFGTPLCVVMDGRYRIEIQKGFDPSLLDSVIRVLKGL